MQELASKGVGFASSSQANYRSIGPCHRPAPHRLGRSCPSNPVLEADGEAPANWSAKLAARRIARELAYRLYTMCEAKEGDAGSALLHGLSELA